MNLKGSPSPETIEKQFEWCAYFIYSKRCFKQIEHFNDAIGLSKNPKPDNSHHTTRTIILDTVDESTNDLKRLPLTKEQKTFFLWDDRLSQETWKEDTFCWNSHVLRVRCEQTQPNHGIPRNVIRVGAVAHEMERMNDLKEREQEKERHA